MNNNLFGKQFIEYIRMTIPEAKLASGDKEIVCRCKYCMDSSDMNHGHMYIHVPESDSDPPMFHCFKCQTSGIIDSRTLIDWGIYDPSMGSQIDKINQSAIKKQKLHGYTREWYRFSNYYIENYNLALLKLKYINSRIGTNLDIQTCLKEKIIFNLDETLRYNNIDNLTRYPNIVNELSKYFVGFLSLDNNFINLRRIVGEGIVNSKIDKRYINYNIHDKKDNTEKMYVMPVTLDLCQPYKVQMHIAEGPFDILSIKYNIRNGEPGIYAAVTGSGYERLVIHLMNTFQVFYFDLHLYPDNDNHGNDDNMIHIANLLKPYGVDVYIHRNMSPGEKDFGVCKDKIKEQVYKI